MLNLVGSGDTKI